MRTRFSEAQIAQLLHVAWWNWPIDRIKQFEALLCSADIDAFILAALADPDASASHS